MIQCKDLEREFFKNISPTESRLVWTENLIHQLFALINFVFWKNLFRSDILFDYKK